MDHHAAVGATGDIRRIRRQVLRRPAQHQRLHPALPQRRRQLAPPGLHARVRLRGLHRAAGVAGAGRSARASRTVTCRSARRSRTSLTRPGPWWVYLEAFGECLPRRENKVSLNHDKRDKWGMPTLDIDMSYGPNELAMRKDMERSAVEMLEAAGLQTVKGFRHDAAPRRGDPRDGDRAHGEEPARLGRQRVQPVPRFAATSSSPTAPA